MNCQRITYTETTDIIIWHCPTCGYRFYERVPNTDGGNRVSCPLCGRPINWN